MLVDFFQYQQLFYLVWHFQSHTSVFIFFHTDAHARMICSSQRESHCPFVQRVSFSVFLGIGVDMQLNMHSSHCGNVVNVWLIDLYSDWFMYFVTMNGFIFSEQGWAFVHLYLFIYVFINSVPIKHCVEGSWWVLCDKQLLFVWRYWLCFQGLSVF